MALKHWENLNANIAFSQDSSDAASQNYLVLGSRRGTPQWFDWQDLLYTSGSFNHVTVWDDFVGPATTVPERWGTNLASTGTVTLGGTGELNLLTAATLNDFTTASTGLLWTVNKGWTFFDVRAKISALTTVAVEIGLSDALSEAAGLAFSNHTVASVTDVATNAAVFAFDSAGDANWNLLTVNAGTPAAVTVGSAPTAATYENFRIIVSPTGDVYGYHNGTLVSRVKNAIATTAVLTGWFTIKALAGAARTLGLDYVGIVGERA